MESFVNQPFIDKQAKYAKWGSYVGFGALFLGLLTTSRQPIIAYVFLLVGLLGATFGSYMASRYVREPRPDQTLAEVMAGLDKRFSAYHYYLPSNHVIVSHHGFTVVEPRLMQGTISFDGSRWRHRAGFRKLMQLFGEPSLGKPDQDVERHIGWVKEWIDEVLPEMDVPVNGIVLFAGDGVELDLSGESDVPVMVAADLATYLKEGLKGLPTLSTAKQKELRRLLDEVVALEAEESK